MSTRGYGILTFFKMHIFIAIWSLDILPNMLVISKLDNQKLYQESIKSKHYTNAFNELNERLVELENIVQPGKKSDFQKLQGWVHSKKHFH